MEILSPTPKPNRCLIRAFMLLDCTIQPVFGGTKKMIFLNMMSILCFKKVNLNTGEAQ